MGLDTSHDCWHGPYSSFMEWREELHRYTAPIREHTLSEAWEHHDYDGQYPINVLMNHSDCDGEIEHKDCKPLAEALQKIADVMPQRAFYDRSKPATERFIAGLLLAHEKGENVDFH